MAICTFFGHSECPRLEREALFSVVRGLVDSGRAHDFYVGDSGGFDCMARGVLREMLSSGAPIRYGVVLAYMPQSDVRFGSERVVFPAGLEFVPPRYAIPWRNCWMLDRADYVITYINHRWGGASRFAELAERHGKSVIRLGSL